MPRGRAWSNHEKGVLTRFYPLEGAKGVHARLNGSRTLVAIKSRARDHGIKVGDVPGFIPAVSVHPYEHQSTRGARAHFRIIDAAKADGVLLEAGSGLNTILLVPIEWADSYVARLGEVLELERTTRGWLGSREAAARIGCGKSSLCLCVSERRGNPRLRRAVGAVRVVRLPGSGGSGEFRFHPGDVEAAGRWYRSAVREGVA